MSDISSEKPPQQLDEETAEKQNCGEFLCTDAALDLSQPISHLINSVSLSDGGVVNSIPAQKATHAKMHNVFQQVRSQIKSQVDTKVPKNGILELVQRIKSRELEMATVNGPPNSDKSNDLQKTIPEIFTDEYTDDVDLRSEELTAFFQNELEASKVALRKEFEEQIAKLQMEMQAYTDRALIGLESKVQNMQTYNHSRLQRVWQPEQTEAKNLMKKQKSPAAPLLGPRKTRILNRTMTTLTPKTCTPIVLGPRSKSETLSSTSTLLLLQDPDFHVLSSQGTKHYKSHEPLLPACPRLHHRKKVVRNKAEAGN